MIDRSSRSALIRVAILVVAWLPGPAAGAGPVDAAAPAERIPVRMRISVEPAGIGVVYLLDRPADALPIGASADSLGKAEGLELAAGTLRGSDGRPRDRFAVQFVPDKAARDRVYPLLSRVEPGALVLHLPSIVPDPARFQAAIDVALAPGMALLAGTTRVNAGDAGQTVHVDAENRYLFIGPASGVTDEGFATIAGSGASPALVRLVSEVLKSSLDDYQGGLAQRLDARPILVVAETSRERSGNFTWRGDTTDNFMFLRFDGAGWSDDAARRRNIETFVRHEAFHLWNGWTFRQEPQNERAWLSEGSAEFAALGSALERGAIDRAYFDDTMSRYLNECRELLDDRSLVFADKGRAPYACGTVAQWIAGLRADATPFAEFLRAWRPLFANAARGTRRYSIDDWMLEVAEAGDPTLRAVEFITRDDGEDRWRAIVPVLTHLGAAIETRVPDAARLRTQLLMHLLGGVCRGQYGFYGRDGFVKLDTGARCAPLPTDPEVDSVAGQNIFGDALAAFENAMRRCAEGGDVELARSGGAGRWKVACRRPLPPPFEYRIGAATASRP